MISSRSHAVFSSLTNAIMSSPTCFGRVHHRTSGVSRVGSVDLGGVFASLASLLADKSIASTQTGAAAKGWDGPRVAIAPTSKPWSRQRRLELVIKTEYTS